MFRAHYTHPDKNTTPEAVTSAVDNFLKEHGGPGEMIDFLVLEVWDKFGCFEVEASERETVEKLPEEFQGYKRGNIELV